MMIRIFTGRSLIVSALALLVVVSGCRYRDLPPDASEAIILLNENMEPAQAFSLLDTVHVGLAPLFRPRTPHTITIRAADGKTVISQTRLMTDDRGSVPPVPVWYDVGLVTRGELAGTVDPKPLQIRSFEVNVKGGETDLTLPFTLLLGGGVVKGASRPDLPPAPVVWSADKNGRLRNSFVHDDNGRLTDTYDDEVYLGGTGFNPAKQSVHAYVTLARRWNDRDPIAPVMITGPVEVPILADGSLDGEVLLWDIDIVSENEDTVFDIVVDFDKDGRYDAPRDSEAPFGTWDSPGPDAVSSRARPGFYVVHNPGVPLSDNSLKNPLPEPEPLPEPIEDSNDPNYIDPNPAQDTDSDGISDYAEAYTHGTDPDVADTDEDGLSDCQEVRHTVREECENPGFSGALDGGHGTEPVNPDTDGDGLSEGDEIEKTGTDPLKLDTDEGGTPDGQEVIDGTDPLDTGSDLYRGDVNVNIASTGHFSVESGTWGYADIFNANGADTLSNEHVAAGLKAIWNPWMTPVTMLTDPEFAVKNQAKNGTLPEGFADISNLTVDIYVVEFPAGATDISELEGMTLTDVTGNVDRIAVQWGSHAGLGQQTVWHPPMTVGDYLLIVDVNLDGVYTPHVDMVDARRTKSKSGEFTPGFTVVRSAPEPSR